MPDIDNACLTEVSLECLLHALGDPTRLAIVRALYEHGELSCSEATPADVPKSTQTTHFKTLRAAGLIETRKDATRYLSRLLFDECEQRFPGVLRSVLEAKAPTACPKLGRTAL